MHTPHPRRSALAWLSTAIGWPLLAPHHAAWAQQRPDPTPEWVLVVVSATSTVEVPESKELFDLYTGRRTTLPGQTATHAIERPRGNEARTLFYAALGQATPAQVDSHWARLQFSGRLRPPAQAHDDADLVQRLRADPFAIGYLLELPKDSGLKVARRLPRRPPAQP